MELYENCLQFTYSTDVCIIWSHFTIGKSENTWIALKVNEQNKTICALVVTANDFALNYKSSSWFFYVKLQAKKSFW